MNTSLPPSMEALKQAWQQQPENLYLALQWGQAQIETGQVAQGLAVYQQALRIYPHDWRVYQRLGEVYDQQDALPQAVGFFQKALQLNPQNADLLWALGRTLERDFQLTDAQHYYQQAVQLNPSYFMPALNKRLQYLCHRCELENVVAICRDLLDPEARQAQWVLRLPPGVRLALSRANQSYHSLLLMTLFSIANLPWKTLVDEAYAWNQRWMPAESSPPLWVQTPNPERRLRIGYLSNEFHLNPMGAYELIFRTHDRERFELYAYADVEVENARSDRMRQYFSAWRSIRGLSLAEVEQQMRADQLDILVEISGHIQSDWLPVLSRRVAPVQISGGSNPPFITGMTAVDYLMVDPLTLPPERTSLLKGPWLPIESIVKWTIPDNLPPVSPLPYQQNGYITFGSSNSLNKLTPPVIALWAQILTAIPNSRLCLKTYALNDIHLQQWLFQRFANYGIESERLILYGACPEYPHLPFFYGQVDICLDPFPYSGAITTTESLLMGVPVLTLRDGSHGLGVSVMQGTNLPEWVAADPLAYLQRAVEWAQKPDALAELRTRLRDITRKSPMCDSNRQAQDVEALYLQVWQTWCHSQSTVS